MGIPKLDWFLWVMMTLLLTCCKCAVQAKGQSTSSPSSVVVQGFEQMGNDWNSFRDMFAKDAVIKYCLGSQSPCTEGSLDTVLGSWETALKFSLFQSTILAEHPENFVMHWSQYVESKNHVCTGLWSGYSTIEMRKAKIQRLVTFSEDSSGVMECIHGSNSVM